MTLETATEQPACICGSARPASHVVRARDEISGEDFTYLRCPDCSLERLSPRPTRERIGGYYPAFYVPHVGYGALTAMDRFKRLVYEVFWAPAGEVRPDLVRWRPLLRLALFPFRNRTILAFVPPATRRVFEFGAAKGTDLLAFKAAGWQAEGCEPSRQACDLAAAQGIQLQQTTAEEAVLDPQAFTCILFNNVFEHIHDPVAVLQKCADAMRPDGVLILIVPNHHAWTPRVFGAAWPGYDAPRHIWGWNPAVMNAELARAGFRVEAVHHQATGAWLWRSVFDGRHAPDPPSRVALWLSRRAPWVGLPFSIVAAWSRHGDFIRVIARRASGA